MPDQQHLHVSSCRRVVSSVGWPVSHRALTRGARPSPNLQWRRSNDIRSRGGLFHALLPERRQDYLQSIFRAAAPGAALYILAFAAGALGERDDSDRPGPRGFTETELRDAVSTFWRVDDVRPAKVYGNDSALASSGRALPNVEHDNEGHFMAPGFLLSAHKPEE
jgi:hypothetical protein